ncbi:MAG: cupin domain-containing protein [Myxococcota bacterium]
MTPRRIDKPWGHEEIWAHTEHYVGKVLFIRAGHRLSMQHHVTKEETIRVSSGSLQLTLEGLDGEIVEQVMRAGDICHIPPGRRHRLRALTDVTVYEVSTPQLSDVVRHADDYGRA